MRFTVFGSSGFIGRALASHLIEMGHDLFLPEKGSRTFQKKSLGHVIYCVGLTSDFRTRPFDTIDAHIFAASEVLRFGEFESFLYLSSTRVYQNATSTDELAQIPVNPSVSGELYNLSKLAGETLTLNSGGPNTRVARLSNVIGPKASIQTNSFVGLIAKDAAAGRVIMQTSPETCKDYVWIGDVVSILTQIASRGRDRIYNVASGRSIRHIEWTNALKISTGCEVVYQKNAPNLSFSPIEIGRIRNEFAYVPHDVRSRMPGLFGVE